MEHQPVPVHLSFDDLYDRTCFVSTTHILGEEVLKVGVCFPDSEGMMLSPELAGKLWPLIKKFSENKTLK